MQIIQKPIVKPPVTLVVTEEELKIIYIAIGKTSPNCINDVANTKKWHIENPDNVYRIFEVLCNYFGDNAK
jgi:hypothetical protein